MFLLDSRSCGLRRDRRSGQTYHHACFVALGPWRLASLASSVISPKNKDGQKQSHGGENTLMKKYHQQEKHTHTHTHTHTHSVSLSSPSMSCAPRRTPFTDWLQRTTKKVMMRKSVIQLLATKHSLQSCWRGYLELYSEGPKGGRRKGGRGRKLSHFSFCCAFRCLCGLFSLFPLSGVKKKLWQFMTRAPLPPAPFADSWCIGLSPTRTSINNSSSSSSSSSTATPKSQKLWNAWDEGLGHEKEIQVGIKAHNLIHWPKLILWLPSTLTKT